MYVDLRSAIGRGLFIQKEFDPGFFRPIEKALGPGRTYLDLGANVGFYALLARDIVGETGRVYAFEVDERALRCLSKTVRSRGITNLHVNKAAVGRRNGKAYVVKQRDSGHTYVSDRMIRGATEISVTTLDNWFERENRPQIDVVKIDLEGAELDALQGAQRMLSERRPVIVCEAAGAAGPTKSTVALRLRELGYRVEAIPEVCSPAIVAYPE